MDALNVLYEDRDIIVCLKPAGTPSQADVSGTKDMLTLVEEHIRADGGRAVPGLVHRLDRDTGGLMVFGKQTSATAKLNLQFQDKGNRVVKEYLALVSGTPEPAAGKMTDYLVTNRTIGKTFVVQPSAQGAKEAVLSYVTCNSGLEHPRGGQVSLVRVRLFTGRTHQIRAQFSHRGYPLCGDGKYGSEIKGGMTLFAWRLSFEHPVSGKRMEFGAMPEEDDFFSAVCRENAAAIESAILGD